MTSDFEVVRSVLWVVLAQMLVCSILKDMGQSPIAHFSAVVMQSATAENWFRICNVSATAIRVNRARE